MLDELNDIPWANLQCLGGSAEHMPEAVRGLLSADLETVERSYWRLENHVVVQGTVYEAGTLLPPILIRALDFAAYPWRVLELLFQIGNGLPQQPYSGPDFHRAVVVGLEQWLHTSPGADPALRRAVEEDLRGLQEALGTGN